MRYFRKTYNFSLADPLIGLSCQARNSLNTALARRLAGPAQQVTAYEWQIFLNTPFLQVSSNPTEQETELRNIFFEGGVERQTSDFAHFYPELMRFWLLQMENWRSFLRTFQCDLAKFVRRQRIRPAVAGIRWLRPDMSDPHDGNKSVVCVRFANGEEWFYKPRAPRQSTLWFEMLARINRAGFSHPFTIPRLVPGRDHHWMESIREHSCRSFGQQRDFWFRSGALLWLVNALAGVDFHVGNLVCQGDQPVFVDCETLLHPLTAGAQDRTLSATRLTRTGMLPLGGGFETAALGPMTASRVCGPRRCLGARDICLAVIDGWKAMMEFLTQPKNIRALTDIYRQLQATDCRVIHRSTAQYHAILQSSFSPALLKDATRRRQFLRQACRSSNPSRLVAGEEARALRDLDIPIFFGRCRRRSALPSRSQSKDAVRTIATCLSGIFQGSPSATSQPRDRANTYMDTSLRRQKDLVNSERAVARSTSQVRRGLLSGRIRRL